MAKENVVKWNYNQETAILSLMKAKTKDVIFGSIDLNEIPGFNTLPEYAQFYLQYGIRQNVADPNAGAKGEEKVEGMKSRLTEWKEATFARANRAEKTDLDAEGVVYSLVELRIMAAHPTLAKIMTVKMKAKLAELEKLAEAETAKKVKK